MKYGLKNRKSQQGFTLIESLMTLLVLTIGLLGVAGMQMEGLRTGGLAMQRTVVVVKVQEMIERIRANSENLASYGAGAGSDHGCNSGSVCTPAQMAEHDVFMWRQDLVSILPVVVNSTVDIVNNNATITVDWQDRGDDYSYAITAQVIYLPE